MPFDVNNAYIDRPRIIYGIEISIPSPPKMQGKLFATK
jgi:hypothetical protein